MRDEKRITFGGTNRNIYGLQTSWMEWNPWVTNPAEILNVRGPLIIFS